MDRPTDRDCVSRQNVKTMIGQIEAIYLYIYADTLEAVVADESIGWLVCRPERSWRCGFFILFHSTVIP